MKHFQMALTRADKRVVKVLVCVIMLSLAVACLASCSRGEGLEEEEHAVGIRVKDGGAMEDTVVTIHFTRFEMEAMTRTPGATTRAAVSETANYLDVWIYEGTEEIAAVHQASTDTGFGTVSVRLDKAKTYTLYATAHKGDGAATLSEGIISWPNDKIRDTFYASTTFSPADGLTVSVELARIVAQVKLTTTDAVPDDAAKLTITIGGVHDRWSIADGASHALDRSTSYSPIGTASDGTASFTTHVIATSAQTLHTVTITAYDASDQPILSRTLSDVPLRNGYRTQYQGELFTSKVLTMSFSTAADWTEYDIVSF